MTPSMERLAAKRAAAAATSTGDGVGGAAHTANTEVSRAGEMQVVAVDEELVSPSKRARKCRGSGPTADEEVEGRTLHSFGTGKGGDIEEELYEEDAEDADDIEDEGAAYVDDNDVGFVVSSSAAAPVVAAAATRATSVSAKASFSSPSAATAKSPLSSGFCPPALQVILSTCLATSVSKCPHGSSSRADTIVLQFVNAHSPTLFSLCLPCPCSVSPVAAMPVGSQNAESPMSASGEKEEATLLGETLVYDDKVEKHQQQTESEGTLVYNELTEGKIVHGSDQQQRPQNKQMTPGAESGELGIEVEGKVDGDDLGLVEDFL